MQRLGPPHWRPLSAGPGLWRAGRPTTRWSRREITRLGARLMAHDLAALGINVDCVPVLDVPDPAGHDIIGDRAYGETPDEVAPAGPRRRRGPDRRRRRCRSSSTSPATAAPWPTATWTCRWSTPRCDELDARDFAPFRVLSDMPMAMTAHVVYTAIDPKRPATTSQQGDRAR